MTKGQKVFVSIVVSVVVALVGLKVACYYGLKSPANEVELSHIVEINTETGYATVVWTEYSDESAEIVEYNAVVPFKAIQYYDGDDVHVLDLDKVDFESDPESTIQILSRKLAGITIAEEEVADNL